MKTPRRYGFVKHEKGCAALKGARRGEWKTPWMVWYASMSPVPDSPDELERVFHMKCIDGSCPARFTVRYCDLAVFLTRASEAKR